MTDDRIKKQAETFAELPSSKDRALFLQRLTKDLEEAGLFKGLKVSSREAAIGKWLTENCKGYTGNYTRYKGLLTLGEAAVPLWEALDAKEITMNTAGEICWDAKNEQKRRKAEGEDPMALSVLVRQYLELERAGKRPRRYTHSAKGVTGSKVAATKTFFRTVRKQIDKITAPLLEEYAGDVRAKLIGDNLSADLYMALTAFSNALSRLNSNQQQTKEIVQLGAVRKACTVLNINPPRNGKPLDLGKAAQQKRLLAREYHPDMKDGDEVMRGKLEEVLAAYEQCAAWNESVSQ